MRTRPSSSAQTVALARSHLTWMGVIDDPQASAFLPRNLSFAGAAMRLRPLRRLSRTPTLSFLAARTLFFDDAVTRGTDAGATSVVIVGAGYDTRAWRLRKPGVAYFEVDHPATQADKRSRAPSGGPGFVAVDLTQDSLVDALLDHGYPGGAKAVFIVEGLTMYLTKEAVVATLSALADLSGAGSQLAANFTVSGGGSVKPISRVAARAIRTVWGARGEPTVEWVVPEELGDLLLETGWLATEITPGPTLAQRYLRDSELPTEGVSLGAIVVSAVRHEPAS